MSARESTIKVGDLSKAIAGELDLLSSKVRDGVNKAGRKAANDVKKEVERLSPQSKRKGMKAGVHYKNGWSVKTEKGSIVETNSYVVHNKLKPWLTHLLEHGHRHYLPNGRYWGFMLGRPHIEPARDYGERMFVKYLEEMEL